MPTILQDQQPAIAYKVKISRKAKYVRLSVAHNASVILTVPWAFDMRKAEKFLQSKLGWVIKKLEFFKNYQGKLGFKFDKREYFKLKSQALLMAKERVSYWNQFYRLSYNRISIKNQKTRWGSASGKGNLNFNYKIAHLPRELLDYLIVHELCHLGEFNHSKKFWALVAKTMPNYKIYRTRLRAIKIWIRKIEKISDLARK